MPGRLHLPDTLGHDRLRLRRVLVVGDVDANLAGNAVGLFGDLHVFDFGQRQQLEAQSVERAASHAVEGTLRATAQLVIGLRRGQAIGSIGVA